MSVWEVILIISLMSFFVTSFMIYCGYRKKDGV